MAEGAAEGQPHPVHTPEATKATAPQRTIDSAATSRQQPTESDQSKEARQARINDLHQRIQESVQDAEKLLGDAIKFPDLSQPTPSKSPEQKKTAGIRGLIGRLINKNKSTETPSTK